MTREPWRCTDVVTVPDVVGLHFREADRTAYDAGLKLAPPNPDGPPLAALAWRADPRVVSQHPAPGSRLWRWDSLVVTVGPPTAGVREPRRPVVPPRADAADPRTYDGAGGSAWDGSTAASASDQQTSSQ